jgi:glycosyltransferase involved in cell wall biosynthesis
MISVIIPVFNGERTLGSCLGCLFASDYQDFEAIVVDDHSSDNSRALARLLPCRLIELPRNGGAAAARNAGAAAAYGSILFFLDADILVRPDSLGRVAALFSERPDLAALFGSYQAETIPSDFFSQYKNLLHHYTHQTSRAEATTFASGFGAVRAEVFAELNGFDPARRFLEDIELGYRMCSKGHRVLLDKQLQMTHCKRYTFGGLIRSDFFGRAIPWTALMLESRTFHNDLNTRINNLLSVPVSTLILAAPLSVRFPWIGVASLLLIVLLIALNYRFLSFLFCKRGALFALEAVAMTWFAYLYSGLGALVACASYGRRRFVERLKARACDA